MKGLLLFLSMGSFLTLMGMWLENPAAPPADTSRVHPAQAQQALDQLLQAQVGPDGRVNYQGIRSHPFGLNTFLAFIRTVSPHSHPELFSTDDDRKAYWINAYNALVMKAVIDHPEISSVKDISFANGLFRRTKFTVGQESLTLDEIESLLRTQYRDPRIHFAINCGSASCPPLGQRIFTGESLDQQLEQKTREFLQNPEAVSLDTVRRVILLSKIFKWYRKDFEDQFGSVLDFIDAYSPVLDLTHHPERKTWKRRYREYDWSLNSRSP